MNTGYLKQERASSLKRQPRVLIQTVAGLCSKRGEHPNEAAKLTWRTSLQSCIAQLEPKHFDSLWAVVLPRRPADAELFLEALEVLLDFEFDEMEAKWCKIFGDVLREDSALPRELALNALRVFGRNVPASFLAPLITDERSRPLYGFLGKLLEDEAMHAEVRRFAPAFAASAKGDAKLDLDEDDDDLASPAEEDARALVFAELAAIGVLPLAGIMRHLSGVLDRRTKLKAPALVMGSIAVALGSAPPRQVWDAARLLVQAFKAKLLVVDRREVMEVVLRLATQVNFDTISTAAFGFPLNPNSDGWWCSSGEEDMAAFHSKLFERYEQLEARLPTTEFLDTYCDALARRCQCDVAAVQASIGQALEGHVKRPVTSKSSPDLRVRLIQIMERLRRAFFDTRDGLKLYDNAFLALAKATDPRETIAALKEIRALPYTFPATAHTDEGPKDRVKPLVDLMRNDKSSDVRRLAVECAFHVVDPRKALTVLQGAVRAATGELDLCVRRTIFDELLRYPSCDEHLTTLIAVGEEPFTGVIFSHDPPLALRAIRLLSRLENLPVPGAALKDAVQRFTKELNVASTCGVAARKLLPIVVAERVVPSERAAASDLSIIEDTILRMLTQSQYRTPTSVQTALLELLAKVLAVNAKASSVHDAEVRLKNLLDTLGLMQSHSFFTAQKRAALAQLAESIVRDVALPWGDHTPRHLDPALRPMLFDDGLSPASVRLLSVVGAVDPLQMKKSGLLDTPGTAAESDVRPARSASKLGYQNAVVAFDTLQAELRRAPVQQQRRLLDCIRSLLDKKIEGCEHIAKRVVPMFAGWLVSSKRPVSILQTLVLLTVAWSPMAMKLDAETENSLIVFSMTPEAVRFACRFSYLLGRLRHGAEWVYDFLHLRILGVDDDTEPVYRALVTLQTLVPHTTDATLVRSVLEPVLRCLHDGELLIRLRSLSTLAAMAPYVRDAHGDIIRQVLQMIRRAKLERGAEAHVDPNPPPSTGAGEVMAEPPEVTSDIEANRTRQLESLLSRGVKLVAILMGDSKKGDRAFGDSVMAQLKAWQVDFSPVEQVLNGAAQKFEMDDPEKHIVRWACRTDAPSIVARDLARCGLRYYVDVWQVPFRSESFVDFTVDATKETQLRKFLSRRDDLREPTVDVPDVRFDSILEKLTILSEACKPSNQLAQSATKSEEDWLLDVTKGLIEFSGDPALQTLSASSAVVLDIFPYAFLAAVSKCTEEKRREETRQALDLMSSIIQRCQKPVRDMLFMLAEFMETNELRETLEKPNKVVSVRRNSEGRFLIQYMQRDDQVVVSGVDKGGPGHLAGVEVGDVLLKFEGERIVRHTDVRSIIQRRNPQETKLELAPGTPDFAVRYNDVFFDLPTLAQVAWQHHSLARAVHFLELHLRGLLRLWRGTKSAAVRGQLEDAAENLAALYCFQEMPLETDGLVQRLSRELGKDWAPRKNDIKAQLPNERHDSAVQRLVANGQFEDLLQALQPMLAKVSPDIVASCAQAAVSLSDWGRLETYIKLLPLRSTEACYYNAFLGVAKWQAANTAECSQAEVRRAVEQARQPLVDKFRAEFQRGYSESLDTLVRLQHLMHLDEVIMYRTTASEERRQKLHLGWAKRLRAMPQNNIGGWTVSLSINRLALDFARASAVAAGKQTPDELEAEVDLRIEYAAMCRAARWGSMGERTLRLLVRAEPETDMKNISLSSVGPNVALAYCRYLWGCKETEEAYGQLRKYMLASKDDAVPAKGPARVRATRVQCRAYCQLAEWANLRGCPEDSLGFLDRAISVDPNNTAALHACGMLKYLASQSPLRTAQEKRRLLRESVEALFHAVTSEGQRDEDRLGRQDLLRIMSIGYNYGHDPEIASAVHAGIAKCRDRVWLRVVPQLIGRLGATVNSWAVELIKRLAKLFTPAFVYPLLLKDMGPETAGRCEEVDTILQCVDDKDIKTTRAVVEELVRLAIFVDEKWTSALYRASSNRLTARQMFAVLHPLRDDMERPGSDRDKAFRTMYLAKVNTGLQMLETNQAEQAWGIFRTMYNDILNNPKYRHKQVTLQDVCGLGNIRDNCVPVPGSSTSDGTAEYISKFDSQVQIFPSKHKPRRIGLWSSSGREYKFLLKGHEDLRQDERVMQLFELINTLFRDPTLKMGNLLVTRYSVVPLSHNVGLIGWIDDSSTVYKLLESYRSTHKIDMHLECEVILRRGKLRSYGEYQNLPRDERRRLLEFAIDRTPSDDLQHILWNQVNSAEAWLEYRSEYGRSLAVMSMVGFVLGLGDRHLNNLMLRRNGNVVHIDFGDCFDIARTRSSFPEAVPFRLTRMLVRALGPVGIDGAFQQTSQQVMELLRINHDSLLAVLETFAYDPLLNLRFVMERPDSSEEERIQQLWGVLEERAVEDAKAATTPAFDSPRTQGKPQFPAGVGAELETISTIATRVLSHVKKEEFDQALAQLSTLAEGSMAGSGRGPLPLVQLVRNFKRLAHDEKRTQEATKVVQNVRLKLRGEDTSICYGPDQARPAPAEGQEGQEGQEPLVRVDDTSAIFQPDSVGVGISVHRRWIHNGAVFELRPEDRGAPHQGEATSVGGQVERLIHAATSITNLADAYLTGWAPFM